MAERTCLAKTSFERESAGGNVRYPERRCPKRQAGKPSLTCRERTGFVAEAATEKTSFTGLRIGSRWRTGLNRASACKDGVPDVLSPGSFSKQAFPGGCAGRFAVQPVLPEAVGKSERVLWRQSCRAGAVKTAGGRVAGLGPAKTGFLYRFAAPYGRRKNGLFRSWQPGHEAGSVCLSVGAPARWKDIGLVPVRKPVFFRDPFGTGGP